MTHLGAGHGALIPIAIGKPVLDRSCGVLDRETVIEVLQLTFDCGVVVAHNQLELDLTRKQLFRQENRFEAQRRTPAR